MDGNSEPGLEAAAIIRQQRVMARPRAVAVEGQEMQIPDLF